MFFEQNNFHDDGYGGIRVSKITTDRIQYAHKKLDKDFSERLFMGEKINIPDIAYEKIISKTIKSALPGIIFRVILGIPFTAVSLYLIVAMVPSLLKNLPSVSMLIPLSMLTAFACSAIFPVKGALRSILLCSSLKKGNYESRAFEIEKKYLYDNDGYSYYVVMNGVWVEVDFKIHKNVSIGDKIICLLVRSGKNTYFIASDSVR